MHSFRSGNRNGKTIWKTQTYNGGKYNIDLQETGWQTRIRPIWLRTGTCGRLLQTWWNFRLGKMWRVCLLTKELVLFQKDSTPYS
jgi:hypothetical protein